jgi:hypothetical protein
LDLTSVVEEGAPDNDTNEYEYEYEYEYDEETTTRDDAAAVAAFYR